MLLAKALGATAAEAKELRPAIQRVSDSVGKSHVQQLRRVAASASRNINRLSKAPACSGGRRGSSSSCDAGAAGAVAVTV